jgi:hypothetical protein
LCVTPRPEGGNSFFAAANTNGPGPEEAPTAMPSPAFAKIPATTFENKSWTFSPL